MESLDPVLPFLRPRSAELTWYMALLAVLFCVGLVGLVGLYIVRWWRHRKQIAVTFLNQAIERRLSDVQARFLLQRARQKRLDTPLALLNSAYVFDRHMGEFAAELAERDPHDPRLDTIAEIRSALGFDELPADQALRSTRQLAAGQTLMMWTAADDIDEYSSWVVVSRDERAIVAAPLLRDERRPFDALSPGEQLVIRFWREGDTEYRFVTEVVELDPRGPTATLRHVDRIERLQHRDFFRLPTHFPICFFALPAEEQNPPPTSESRDLQEQEDKLEETEAGRLPAEKEEETGIGADLKNAVPLYGQVLNLSAGGLFLATAENIPTDSRLLIDPDFDGPFPLQGILCDIVQKTAMPEGFGLQVQFVSLTPSRERQIVRLIYQQQIHALHEFSAIPPDQEPSPKDTVPPDAAPSSTDTSS